MKRVGIVVNGERREVQLLERSSTAVRFAVGGREYSVEFERGVSTSPSAARAASASSPLQGRRLGGDVVASIPGVIVDILVKAGDRVEAGQVLLRIEAMKMQNSVFSPLAGTVVELHVQPGEEVADGRLLLTVSEKASA